jgi:hypothetical protein
MYHNGTDFVMLGVNTGVITTNTLIEVSKASGPQFSIKDSDSTGNAQVGWIDWRDKLDTRAGYIGYGSAGNQDLYLVNENTGGDFRLSTDAQVHLWNDDNGGMTFFEGKTLADDATGTWTSPRGRAHGIWIIKNSWDDSGDGMFSNTGTSVTLWHGGTNFQLGAGSNPNIDGDINCWMSSSTVLSIKNRTGVSNSIQVYFFGG